MSACPSCGFELPSSRSCPVCASSRGKGSGHETGLLLGLVASLGYFILPTILVSGLIIAFALSYLVEPFGLTPGRSAPPIVAPAADPGGALPDQAGAAAFPPMVAERSTASLAAGAVENNLRRISPELPTSTRKAYLDWMLAHTDETKLLLEKKWDRAQVLLTNKDITSQAVLQAFLFTPREYFARPYNVKKAYDNTAIPIGFGQTISGPHMVSHMTQSIDPARSDRILEIGTGSGYQSALLSELCDQVYTIEIVPALYRETDQIYRRLAARYPEYASITRKNADGYFGWLRYAPFQKIIVTAGIDHIPPPLLRQLAPNGIMIIPVGPPSGQTVLRIIKRPAAGGGFVFERSDVYRGQKVIFVPFTSPGGTRHSLDDSGGGAGE